MPAWQCGHSAKACGLFPMIILLITVPLRPAVAFPVSWQGPGLLPPAGAGEPHGLAGMGGHWHPAAFLCHGKAWCSQGHGPGLEMALSIFAILFPLGLVMLGLRSVTHTISKELTSSKACCENMAHLGLPPGRDM